MPPRPLSVIRELELEMEMELEPASQPASQTDMADRQTARRWTSVARRYIGLWTRREIVVVL